MEKHSQRYSIRKYSFGAASVLLGTAAFALSATTALADENSTVPAADNAGSSAEVAANQAGPQTKVINQTTVGDTTTTTKEVTSPELETAKENAQKANVPAEETEAKVQPSVEAADADNKAQAEAINKSVTDYQTQQAAYEKAKAEYDSKSAEKAAADKLNAQAKGAYDAAMIQYNQDKAAYDAALAQYNIDKATYAQQKIQYEVSLAEKEAADKANAAAKLKYDQEMQAYNAAKADYDSALAQYNADKKKYDSAKATYDSKLAEKAAADKANAAAKAKYDQEKAVYDQAKAKYDQDLAKYQQDKAKYDSAKSTYDSKLAEKAAAEKINAENEAKYNQAKEAYNQARAQYEHQLAEYQTKYEHWKNSKDAYDKFLADHNLTETQAAQELIFEREKDAVHTIEGINTYLTPEAQKRIGTSAVNQYRSNEIKEGDVVTNSPYGNKDNEWLQVKEGDKFTVTYDGLSQSKMIIEGVPQDINKVIYHYSIDELPSFNKAGIAKVSNDPTVTLTVGASTDDPDKAVKVTVDIEFYDKNGQKYDLTKRKAIVALNSLNHWTGAAYVSGEDNPRALTVEARDTEGNTVRGTWNPYADGSHPDIKNGEVQTKSGYADFGGKTVIISANNPLKIVTQSYSVAPNSLETLLNEAVTDESSVKASGGANAHSIGSQNYSYEDEGVQKDDVIGSYYVDAETGLITFVPKKKFQNVEHQEFVNIGDNQYIAIPNSSVTYDPNTHEVTSQADNQYIEHGAVFNGESTSTLPGWDNEDSPYLYYGGAGMRMTNGHLVFTAKGANAVGAPTIYWFAINSTVGYPKNPGEEPPKPKAPTPPTPPKKVIVEVPGEPHEPTPPTSPVAPEPPKMTIIEVPGEPHEPTAPTPPVAPEPPKMTTIEVPGEPHKPTPPTAPVPPTKPKTITVVVPKKPNEPKAPTLPNPPQPPKTISVEVPNEPTPPTKPSVKWHKNIIVESVKTPKPGVPTPPTVPNTPPKSVQPVKSENPKPAQPQPAAEKALPQTGDSNSYGVTVFGAGIIAFSIITMLGAMKRKEN